MKLQILSQLLLSAINAHTEEPLNLESSLQNVLQTQPETPDQILLQDIEGSIPNWIDGSFYRNGPGKFEFNEDKFQHLFDPMALVQQFQVKEGQVKFNSKYIRSRNFKVNTELDQIVYPELGTAAEPDWIHLDENGQELTEEEIIHNRWKFFVEPESKTDNTLVSLHSLCGNMVAFSETLSLHSIDKQSLDTLESFSIEQATNYPKGLIGMTQTPHGMITEEGDFINMMTGILMDTSNGIRPPKVAYYMYRIKNARDGKCSIKEILENMEFSEPTYNENKHSLKIGYMHEGVLAGDYFLAILSSTITDMSLIKDNTVNGRPLLESNRHDPEREQEIRVFNLVNFEWEVARQIPKLPSGIMLHTINGQVLKKTKKETTIQFDGLWSGNPSVLSMFYLDALRQQDSDFEDLRSLTTPSGQPVRIQFKIGGVNSDVQINPLVDNQNPQWKGYTQGGVEFPTINEKTRGKGSNHFWGVGYVQVLGDRLYHTNTQNGQRHMFYQEGYQPSEPVFVQLPENDEEDKGILISTLIPIVENQRGFIVFLEANTMIEIARAYLPENLNLATSFHSIWL